MIDRDKYALVIDDDGYFCEDKIADLLAEVKRLRKGIKAYLDLDIETSDLKELI